MACMLRGIWIFHAESDVRLLMSRRFPTVEKKIEKLLGEDFFPLPSDEEINVMFITEILHEEEDHYVPPGIPEAFHEDYQQGSFAWNPQQEGYAEKLWPMGPVCSICNGKIWPVLFLFKKGYYLMTVVGFEKKQKIESVRALELPQITSAFAVLEDIVEFIPSNLAVSDVAGVSELQYYIRSAIPFGSPVNTHYQLLRKVRHGFPNKEDETNQRTPQWKPYLYKGKSKLTISIVETVNCTLYGKSDYKDECFIAGTVYCCADISGIPEICVPIAYPADSVIRPEVNVHNSAHVVGGIKATKEDSFKVSCTPPTGSFVLCRYRYCSSPIVPVRGFYQIKEMSPVEFRLLLQIQLHPAIGNSFWSCQVRLPFHHRGVIKSIDLKCSGGSFSVTDHGQSILWNLNVRRPRGNLETNLLGELIFESPQSLGEMSADMTGSPARASPAHTASGQGPGVGASSSSASGSHAAARSFGDLGVGSVIRGDPASLKPAAPPQLGAGGALMVNRGGNAVSGSVLTPSGGWMYAKPSGVMAGRDPADTAREAATRSVEGPSSPPPQPTTGFVQDPFLHGVNCYAEVYLEVPEMALSGIMVDPKAVTVYPTTRVYGGVTVQKNVLTGKYVIWNMAGEVHGSHCELEFDEAGSA